MSFGRPRVQCAVVLGLYLERLHKILNVRINHFLFRLTVRYRGGVYKSRLCVFLAEIIGKALVQIQLPPNQREGRQQVSNLVLVPWKRQACSNMFKLQKSSPDNCLFHA